MRAFLLMAPLLLLSACDEEINTVIAADLYGRVTIDGQPGSGLTVTASTDNQRYNATTSADGRYDFSQLPRGSFALRISGQPADVLFADSVQTAELDGSNRRERNFDGYGPVEITGRLIWNQGPKRGVGVGVPGISIRLEDSPLPATDAVTAADGTFRLTGAPGVGVFHAVLGALPAGLRYDDGARRRYRTPVASRNFADTIYVEYEPHASLRVTIRVDGALFNDADVHLNTPLPVTSREYQFNNLPIQPVDVRISGYPPAIRFDTTVKSVQLRQDTETQVEFVGYSAGANRPPVATITSPADGSTFAIGAPITFTGNAVDPEDGTLTGSALRWTRPGLPTTGTGTSFTTSELPLGQNRVVLTASDRFGVTGEAFVDVTIVPVTAGTVAGTVTVYGSPRQGVRLTLSTTPARAVVTDAQGVFSFDNVPAGTYTLTLEPPQFTAFPFLTRSVTVTSGGTVTVNFDGHIG